MWDAETDDDLHKCLVFHPSLRSVADSFEPEGLFRKHHTTQPEGATVTALLLLTDTRWHLAARQLVRRITGAGLINDDGLDILASLFLRAGRCLLWTMPDHWFGPRGPALVLSVGPDPASSESTIRQTAVDSDDDDEDVEDEPMVARRVVVPPLRRWAAGHVISRDPAAWAGIWRDAESVEARSGAAIKCGVLDVIEVLPQAAQDVLIRDAIRWPHQSVRQLGYKLVVEREGALAAQVLAIDDPNSKIRSWAAALLDPAKQPKPKSGPRQATSETSRPQRPEMEQEPLF